MASGKKNTIRIIGGDWRGRKLPVLNHEGLRPTQDRVRETLFNWLAADLAGSRIADLFSGTGALGFEALSRGAAQVDFIEKERRVANNLSENLKLLADKRGKVYNTEAQKWINLQKPGSIDLIFLDPPFGQNLVQQILDQPEFINILAPNAKIYIEQEKSGQIQTKFTLLKEKTTGSLIYSLYQYQT